MPTYTLEVAGMHCSGCEERVEHRLSEVEGVRSVEADHEGGTATVTFVAGQEDEAVLRDGIEALGYEVEAIETA